MACFGDEKCLGDPWLSLESGDLSYLSGDQSVMFSSDRW
jgi:hypothetical protein